MDGGTDRGHAGRVAGGGVLDNDVGRAATVQGYRRPGRIDHCQAAPDVAVLVGRRQEQQDPQRRIVEYIAEQVLDPLGLLGAGPQPSMNASMRTLAE